MWSVSLSITNYFWLSDIPRYFTVQLFSWQLKISVKQNKYIEAYEKEDKNSSKYLNWKCGIRLYIELLINHQIILSIIIWLFDIWQLTKNITYKISLHKVQFIILQYHITELIFPLFMDSDTCLVKWIVVVVKSVLLHWNQQHNHNQK